MSSPRKIEEQNRAVELVYEIFTQLVEESLVTQRLLQGCSETFPPVTQAGSFKQRALRGTEAYDYEAAERL